jgi:murein L,D-transpeptidase YafK
MHIFFLSIFFLIFNGCASSNPSSQVPLSLVKTTESNSTKESCILKKPKISLEEELSQIGAKVGDPIFIRIFKEEKELELWVKTGFQYQLLKIYDICNFSGDLGPKLKEGDRQSPEGFYVVSKDRLNPYSRFYLSMNIGFPNRYDRDRGRTGSNIMIHGGCKSIGCFAMQNMMIDEIYRLSRASLLEGENYFYVSIFPFRMEEDKMDSYKDHKWYTFWQNLKEGYDIFERDHVPPIVRVKKKSYRFYSKVRYELKASLSTMDGENANGDHKN